ncbi:hypothetical protein ACU4GD_11820 [Cupriavidus basilensis]
MRRQTEPPGPAPHFAQQLRKWPDHLGRTATTTPIYTDGLVVRTTIDSRLRAIGQPGRGPRSSAVAGHSECSLGTALEAGLPARGAGARLSCARRPGVPGGAGNPG